jgi:DNA-directed RNA polymerase specialized sigma24 family protein
MCEQRTAITPPPLRQSPVNNIEDELIQRAKSADTEAFCLLAKGYERRIYLLAFHYCHNRQDAEDLSQG